MTRTQRISTATTALALAIAAFTVFWVWRLLAWVLPYLDPDHFLGHRLVENHAPVTAAQHWGIVGLHIPILIFGISAAGAAIRLCLYMRGGHFFTIQAGQAVTWIGLLLCATILADAVYVTFDHTVLTWNNSGDSRTITNADGQQVLSLGRKYLPPQYNWPNSHITIFLCGVGFSIFGWIWREAALIEQENKEFI